VLLVLYGAMSVYCNILFHYWYTLSQNVPFLTCYHFDKHDPIMIVFGKNVTEKVRNQRCVVFPHHLSSASAVPCERGNPEESVLVHCACNTVQLRQRSRPPVSWTMPPNSPELSALITRFGQSYSSVSMSRESKRLKKSSSDWLNSSDGEWRT